MAQSALRLRRAVTTVSSIHRSLSSSSGVLSPPPLFGQFVSSPSSEQQSSFIGATVIQSRQFRASPSIFSSASSSNRTYHLYKEGDEITPDTILFEGCDYNHWLITMEFPKDPRPTPEEMVRTYEETCAKGLNISLEEAKKRMYACSTTTYQGFQAVMTEEESEKFQGLPGVVFVLPDSYIDPQNKEYGGDKYINGTIIPRPPPIQRNTGGRFRDRNRNFDRPRYNQPGGPQKYPQPQQGGPQNYPQHQQGGPQNYPQHQQGGPQNYPQHQQGGPQNFPQHQQGGPQNFPSQQHQQGPPQNFPPQQNFGTPGQRNPPHNSWGPMQGDSRNYGATLNYPQQNLGVPRQGERGGPMANNRDHFQADGRGPVPSYQGHYNQGQQGNYNPPQGSQRAYGQENFGGNMNNAPPSAPGDGYYGQGGNSSYGQNFPGQGEGQRFSQGGQGNVHGEQRNHAPLGQTGTDTGKY